MPFPGRRKPPPLLPVQESPPPPPPVPSKPRRCTISRPRSSTSTSMPTSGAELSISVSSSMSAKSTGTAIDASPSPPRPSTSPSPGRMPSRSSRASSAESQAQTHRHHAAPPPSPALQFDVMKRLLAKPAPPPTHAHAHVQRSPDSPASPTADRRPSSSSGRGGSSGADVSSRAAAIRDSYERHGDRKHAHREERNPQPSPTQSQLPSRIHASFHSSPSPSSSSSPSSSPAVLSPRQSPRSHERVQSRNDGLATTATTTATTTIPHSGNHAHQVGYLGYSGTFGRQDTLEAFQERYRRAAAAADDDPSSFPPSPVTPTTPVNMNMNTNTNVTPTKNRPAFSQTTHPGPSSEVVPHDGRATPDSVRLGLLNSSSDNDNASSIAFTSGTRVRAQKPTIITATTALASHERRNKLTKKRTPKFDRATAAARLGSSPSSSSLSSAAPSVSEHLKHDAKAHHRQAHVYAPTHDADADTAHGSDSARSHKPYYTVVGSSAGHVVRAGEPGDFRYDYDPAAAAAAGVDVLGSSAYVYLGGGFGARLGPARGAMSSESSLVAVRKGVKGGRHDAHSRERDADAGGVVASAAGGFAKSLTRKVSGRWKRSAALSSPGNGSDEKLRGDGAGDVKLVDDKEKKLKARRSEPPGRRTSADYAAASATAPSTPSGSGKKIWKLVKRISTGGLRDKYHHHHHHHPHNAQSEDSSPMPSPPPLPSPYWRTGGRGTPPVPVLPKGVAVVDSKKAMSADGHAGARYAEYASGSPFAAPSQPKHRVQSMSASIPKRSKSTGAPAFALHNSPSSVTTSPSAVSSSKSSPGYASSVKRSQSARPQTSPSQPLSFPHATSAPATATAAAVPPAQTNALRRKPSLAGLGFKLGKRSSSIALPSPTRALSPSGWMNWSGSGKSGGGDKGAGAGARFASGPLTSSSSSLVAGRGSSTPPSATTYYELGLEKHIIPPSELHKLHADLDSAESRGAGAVGSSASLPEKATEETGRAKDSAIDSKTRAKLKLDVGSDTRLGRKPSSSSSGVWAVERDTPSVEYRSLPFPPRKREAAVAPAMRRSTSKRTEKSDRAGEFDGALPSGSSASSFPPNEPTSHRPPFPGNDLDNNYDYDYDHDNHDFLDLESRTGEGGMDDLYGDDSEEGNSKDYDVSGSPLIPSFSVENPVNNFSPRRPSADTKNSSSSVLTTTPSAMITSPRSSLFPANTLLNASHAAQRHLQQSISQTSSSSTPTTTDTHTRTPDTTNKYNLTSASADGAASNSPFTDNGAADFRRSYRQVQRDHFSLPPPPRPIGSGSRTGHVAPVPTSSAMGSDSVGSAGASTAPIHSESPDREVMHSVPEMSLPSRPTALELQHKYHYQKHSESGRRDARSTASYATRPVPILARSSTGVSEPVGHSGMSNRRNVSSSPPSQRRHPPPRTSLSVAVAGLKPLPQLPALSPLFADSEYPLIDPIRDQDTGTEEDKDRERDRRKGMIFGKDKVDDEAKERGRKKHKDKSRRKGAKADESDRRDGGKDKWNLTEKQKLEKWDDLLERSARAGGTLHIGGDSGENGLKSDHLRFSTTSTLTS